MQVINKSTLGFGESNLSWAISLDDTGFGYLSNFKFVALTRSAPESVDQNSTFQNVSPGMEHTTMSLEL